MPSDQVSVRQRMLAQKRTLSYCMARRPWTETTGASRAADLIQRAVDLDLDPRTAAETQVVMADKTSTTTREAVEKEEMDQATMKKTP